MSGVNKAIILGNLGATPELRHLPSGQAVCDLRVATNETYTDKNQQKVEKTEWHRICVFGKTAENCAKFLSVGRQVYIEGRLQTRSWDDKETGAKRYMTEIVANTVQFLGGKDSGSRAPSDDFPSETKPTNGGTSTQADDDSIPF